MFQHIGPTSTKNMACQASNLGYKVKSLLTIPFLHAMT